MKGYDVGDQKIDTMGVAEGSGASAEKLAASCARFSHLNEGIDFDTLENYEFGGKLARQIGAGLSGDREEDSSKAKIHESEEAMQAAARPQDWKAKLAEMDHEERVAATLACLERKNNQKEILYDLLAFCGTERTEEECEAFLTAHKQFADGYHSASKYLLFMQRTGALEEKEFDSEGVLITEAMRDELREMEVPEEEIDQIAIEWHFITTDAGQEAMRRFDPADRTREMLSTQAATRLPSYARLLTFCEEPRSLDEITRFMEDDPGLERDEQTGVMHMQPSAYIGKLDQAGALTWEEGWKTTPGGMEVLKALEEGQLQTS